MKCFYHHSSDAVGVCRHCLKGICSACAVDFGNGLACKNSCEEKAIATAQLVSNTINSQRGLKYGRFMGPIFSMVMGSIFAGWAIYCGSIFRFEGVLGILFIIMGVFSLAYSLKYAKPITGEKP